MLCGVVSMVCVGELCDLCVVLGLLVNVWGICVCVGVFMWCVLCLCVRDVLCVYDEYIGCVHVGYMYIACTCEHQSNVSGRGYNAYKVQNYIVPLFEGKVIC